VNFRRVARLRAERTHDGCSLDAERLAWRYSRENEPGGLPNSRFVWFFTRDAYNSDIPTNG
jgi:hypothetical protein